VRVVLSILLVAACHGSEQKPPPPQAMPVELATLKPDKVVDASEYMTTLRPLTASALQPQVEGHVTGIRVHAGDAVEAGQLLMEIDPGPTPAAMTRARATRSSREASLELAERNLERVRALVAKGALPQQELDNAQTAAASTRSDVAALGAEIASNAVQLRYYRISAPSAGTVGDITVRVGDLVTPQTKLTSVTDNRVLEANMAVPVERAAQVKVGLSVQILDDQARVVAEGAVSFVSPQVNPDTQSVLVKANINNPDSRLRAEQLTRGRIVWRTRDGLVVPVLAVTRLGGQAFVYVAANAPNGLIARQRPVQLGELTNNAYVVEHGLNAGERIVVSQIQKLRDGASIAPAPAGSAKPGAPGGPPEGQAGSSAPPAGHAGSSAPPTGSGGSGGSASTSSQSRM
jgi:RND family efflux transporter MFP subunit